MRSAMAFLSVLFVAGWMAPAALGQPATGPRAADTASPEAIVAALYDVISGPAGQARDWDRFRGLFAPGARLVPAAPRKDGAAPVALSPDDYAARANDAFLKAGFFEREVSRKADGFGTIEKPFARGINSIQLMQHGGRWWIVTVMWDQERPDNPIPAKYLEGRLP
ncbi:MAG: hypothetical protein MUE61_12885 [Vicinamibacterales bacterium]|nr:hypothetical protein [Vicinamibacterales bacterium]